MSNSVPKNSSNIYNEVFHYNTQNDDIVQMLVTHTCTEKTSCINW